MEQSKDRMPDTEFIQGKRTEVFKTKLDVKNNNFEHFFVIVKGDETRNYDPVTFLNYVLEAYYLAADKAKAINEKILCIINARSKISRLIRHYGLDRFEYDFSRIFADIEDTMDRLKAYKEYGVNNNEVKPEIIPFHFSEYLSPLGKSILPELIKEFAESKPKQFAYMLFALVELGVLPSSALRSYHTQLHKSLSATFGKVGTRQSLSMNISSLLCADSYDKRKIMESKARIQKILNLE
jgi:hypothetical protein